MFMISEPNARVRSQAKEGGPSPGRVPAHVGAAGQNAPKGKDSHPRVDAHRLTRVFPRIAWIRNGRHRGCRRLGVGRGWGHG